MKIAFLHNDFRAYWKGRLYFLYNYFRRCGIDVAVVEIFGSATAYTFDKSITNEDWWHCLFLSEQHHELSTKEVKNVLLSRLDAINPDILVAGPIAFSSGAVGLQWAKKNQKKVILFDDAKHSVYNRNRLVNWVKKSLTSQADAFLVPSEDYVAEYQNWSIQKDRLFYGLNCIDNNYYFRKRRRPKFQMHTFICVARLVPIKNLDLLVECWGEVEKKTPNYQLLIVGDGPEHNNLKKKIENLRLSSVKLLGAQNKKVIATLLVQSEAFILPSYREGWALVVNEAMAAGVPVLLSNKINAGHTLLCETLNGRSFHPTDKDDLLKSILWFMNIDSSKKHLLSQNASSSIEKFNYKYLAAQLHSAFRYLNNHSSKTVNPVNKMLMTFWNGKFKTSNWDTIK